MGFPDGERPFLEFNPELAEPYRFRDWGLYYARLYDQPDDLRIEVLLSGTQQRRRLLTGSFYGLYDIGQEGPPFDLTDALTEELFLASFQPTANRHEYTRVPWLAYRVTAEMLAATNGYIRNRRVDGQWDQPYPVRVGDWLILQADGYVQVMPDSQFQELFRAVV
jgi:hypothetical protein